MKSAATAASRENDHPHCRKRRRQKKREWDSTKKKYQEKKVAIVRQIFLLLLLLPMLLTLINSSFLSFGCCCEILIAWKIYACIFMWEFNRKEKKKMHLKVPSGQKCSTLMIERRRSNTKKNEKKSEKFAHCKKGTTRKTRR